MSDNTITIVEIVETEYGEKAVLDSPYEARHAISNLPWKEYQEELDEFGSLKDKARSRGNQPEKSSELLEVFDAMEQFDFSDDFATHSTWEPSALGGDGAWMIDRECLDEAAEFWEFFGYNVQSEV